MMLKSSPTVKNAVKEAMERINAGKSYEAPKTTPKPRDVMYPGAKYEDIMKMQKAGQGFGNWSGKPYEFQKAKGGKINLKDCKVTTHEKNSKHKDW